MTSCEILHEVLSGTGADEVSSRIGACLSAARDYEGFTAEVKALRVLCTQMNTSRGTFPTCVLVQCEQALGVFGDILRAREWIIEDLRSGSDLHGCDDGVQQVAAYITSVKQLPNNMQRARAFDSARYLGATQIVRGYAQRRAVLDFEASAEWLMGRLQECRSKRTRRGTAQFKRSKQARREMPILVAPQPEQSPSRRWIELLMYQRSSAGERVAPI